MLALFVEAPAIFLGFYVWLVGIKGGWRMQDFMALRSAGRALMGGHSPYPAADPHQLLAAKHLVYPPLVGYLFTPFSVLPYSIAAPLYFVLMPAALAAAMALLGVHDWRCYGMVFLWYPTVACLGTGALGPFLVLLLAVAWRYRDRPLVVAPALAIAIVAKLFLWPLAVWLLATRRWRSTALTVTAVVAALLVPFAPLGSKGLHDYPHLLRALDRIFGPVSFSSNTLFHAVGLRGLAAAALVLFVGGTLTASALVLGMRDRDESALVITLLAALMTSPIVWMHYYVLVVIALALTRPRLSALWFLPLLYWASPELESFGELRRLIVGVGVTLAVILFGVRSMKSAGVPLNAKVVQTPSAAVGRAAQGLLSR
jgi:alpha-1,2-mannosyltransferase